MLDVANSILARFNHHHPINYHHPAKIEGTHFCKLPLSDQNRGHTFLQITTTTQFPPPDQNRWHTFWQITTTTQLPPPAKIDRTRTDQITSHPRIASRMARKDRESEYNHDTHN
jgi:hypothetical protein